MRRRGLRLGGVLTAVSIAVALVAPAPVAAADTQAPELVSVQLSSSSVSVFGLDHATVTVSVHLRDDTGVVEAIPPGGDLRTPLVSLSRVTPAESFFFGTEDTRYLELPPAEDPADGTWTANVLVPANYHGTWRVSGVLAQDAAGNQLGVDPQSQGINATLDVIGSHRPWATIGFAPQPVAGNRSLTAKGRVFYRDTGGPVASRQVVLGAGEGCVNTLLLGGVTATTDANGYYAAAYPVGLSPYQPACIFVINPHTARFDSANVARIVARAAVPVVRYAVGASLADSRIAFGTQARVIGNVVPNPDFQGPAYVYLQRSVGGTWRTIANARVRASGRYTLTTRPTSRGVFHYRVYKAGCCDGRLLGGVSRTVTLTVV
jgi:hypothetical protein